MQTLDEYEQQSGQKINKEKSLFYVHDKIARTVIQEVESCIGFSRGKFPLMHLGCPIGHARKRKIHYFDLIKKVHNKLQTWKGKILSFGGKHVLINNVLNSIPIYLLSAIIPPNCVIHELHRIFARFLWNFKEVGRNKHWVAWDVICRPKEEGGLGIRSLFDVSKALFAKLWWIFRTQKSMWTIFMWNKYCKRHAPQVVEWKGGSQTWKYMIEARNYVDQEI